MGNFGLCLLLPVFLAANAHAGKCNQEHLCEGDHTWYCEVGHCTAVDLAYLTAGGVALKFPESSIPIETNGNSVVVTKDFVCVPKAPIKACKGSFAQWKILDQYHSGEIVGYTLGGLLAVREAEGDPVPVAAKNIIKTQDQPCVPVLGDCPGDEVYVEQRGKLELLKLDKVNLRSGTWLSGGQEGKFSQIASLKSEACGEDKDGNSICPGSPVLVNKELGMVLGAFADGSLIVSTPKGNIQRPASSQVVRHSVSGNEERQIAAGLTQISDINELLKVQQWKNCGGPLSVVSREKIPTPDLSCDEKGSLSTGDDSPNKAKFEALLRKGMAAPLDKFLMLWYPDRGGDGLDRSSPYFTCEKSEDTSFDRLGPGCQPDILYSWGPIEKRDTILKSLGDGQPWQDKPNQEHTVFTSISAASTMDYGNVLMRFKIRPSANYVLGGHAWANPDKNTVAVRTESAHDFNFKDASVVDNVSSGMPEVYDEVVRDILHFKSGKRVSVYSEWYLGLGSYPGHEKLLTQNIDEHGFSEDTIKAGLLELIREILAGEGTTHYRQGACRNRSLNFSSVNPSYIQPVISPK